MERIVDVSTRRIQLQRRPASASASQGFQRGATDGAIGHVGLRESVFMIADTLGWRLDDVVETLEPVIAHATARRPSSTASSKGYARACGSPRAASWTATR